MIKDDFLNMGYIDALMIVDRNFKIVNTYRYNPRFNDLYVENAGSDYLGKNYFEVYPEISKSESTMYESMKYEKVVYKNNQIFKDYNGRIFSTCNVTIPIKRGGKVVGAIELSKDITSINDLKSKIFEKNKSMAELSDIVNNDFITFDDIITCNTEMIDNIRKAKIFIDLPNPTLIYGETGTGKELFVQAMVNSSNKYKREFVALNCAAVPENLIESTLFGAEKGAYTGATDKVGLFELANGGILFLDELNSMPYDIQAKLLRVLQDNKIRPIGSSKEKKVNVKIIAAMNMDPMKAIKEKRLREDLFYRLSSSVIQLVPLRERKEDIPLYANYFIKRFNGEYEKEVEGLSRTMTSIFMNYKWNGNVREIKHILENMVSISDENTLTVKNLPIYMKDILECRDSSEDNFQNTNDDSIMFMSLKETLYNAERQGISKVLAYTRGHLKKSAEILGLPRQTLKYRMDRLGIKLSDYKKS